MLPRVIFSVVGVDLLVTVVAASAIASALAATVDNPRLLLCTGCSSAVTTPLSACGINTLSSMLRCSALVALLDGWLLS